MDFMRLSSLHGRFQTHIACEAQLSDATPALRAPSCKAVLQHLITLCADYECGSAKGL